MKINKYEYTDVIGRKRTIFENYDSEKETKKAIIDFLMMYGIYCWNNRNVGVFNAATERYIPASMRGISDIIGLLPDGTFLAIEVKYKYGKPSEDQKAFIEMIKKNNGFACVAKSIKEVMEELEKFRKENMKDVNSG